MGAMASSDGDLAGAAFPSTQWSRLVGGDARGALETLALRYWRPVAAYVRTRWAKTDEEARDAAQEFFLWVLEGDLLAKADPARGRFRGFIKTSLANFVHDLERRRRTAKRGGDRRFVPMDATPLDLPDPSTSPEAALDAAWRAALVEEASAALERELTASGKGEAFAVFRDYYLGDEELDHATLAARHGISPTDVSNRLAYAKRRYRQQLRIAVLETVRDDEDLRAEMAWLFEESA